MRNIFMYELRRRAKSMIVLGSVVAGMTLISIILSLIFNFKLIGFDAPDSQSIPSFAVIWWVLTTLAMFYVGIAMFFTCCSGHIRALACRVGRVPWVHCFAYGVQPFLVVFFDTEGIQQL